MKKKNGSPPQKRADFQNYSPREPFWLSFFFSVKASLGELVPLEILGKQQGFRAKISVQISGSKVQAQSDSKMPFEPAHQLLEWNKQLA